MKAQTRLACFTAALVTVIVPAGLGAPSAVAQTTPKVTFALNWIPYGIHVPFYAALERGLFQAKGVDVKVVRGFGGRTVKDVARQTVHIGLADAGLMLVSKARGMAVKQVAAYFNRDPVAIYALDKSGIRSPKDLEGKLLGTTQAGVDRAKWPTFATLNKVDSSRVKWEFMTAPAKNPSLLAGKVDAIITFATVKPNLDAAASKKGQRIVELRFSDYGIDAYGLSVIASDDYLKAQPDAARRVLAAYVDAVTWSVANSDAALKMFTKRNAAVQPGLAKAHWDITVGLIALPKDNPKAFAKTSAARMKQTRDNIAKGIPVVGKIGVDATFTNEFLP